MLARRMISISRLLLLLSLVLVSYISIAQSSNSKYDPIYGLNPILYNGRAYEFFPKSETGGTQYLLIDFDTRGSIKLRGVTYSNLNLNYDVFNQQLILKYIDEIGSTQLIEISFAWLESFIMDGRSYVILTDANSTKRIYQVLGANMLKVMYYQSKELKNDNIKSPGTQNFTDVQKERYVLINNVLISYKNNKSFIKGFSPDKQDLIKTYIHKHKINVRKAGDYVMTDLINYCNTISGL